MKSYKFIFIINLIILIKYINSEQQCYKCLKESDTCLKIVNDKPVNISNTDILLCSDGFNCVSYYTMPSMHPNRTSSCDTSAKFNEFCDIGRRESCGFGMYCDSSNFNEIPRCKGLKSLQYNDQCNVDDQCESLICNKSTNRCMESEYSCRPNYYWNKDKESCQPIYLTNNNIGSFCFDDSQCSILNTCDNNVCIKKYSLQLNSNCNSDNSCDISKSLVCNEGKCEVFNKTLTNNCKIGGCFDKFEYCDCDSGQCNQYKEYNKECKTIERKLNECSFGRCVITIGSVSVDSCLMKNCGKLVCDYHTKCTNTPCGNHETSYCESKNNYIPNNLIHGMDDNDDGSDAIDKNNNLDINNSSSPSLLNNNFSKTILILLIYNLINSFIF